MKLIQFIVLLTFLIGCQKNTLESAEKRYNSKDYRGAITELTQIISNNPKNVNAYILRGRAKGKLGDKFGAIRDLTYAIELDPFNANAYWRRGNILHNSDSLKSAYQDYTNCIRLLSNASAAYNNRANILSDWGMHSEALEDYNKAIRYSPDYTLAYINRGKLKLSNLNDKEGACLDFSRAGELGSKQAYELIELFCN